MSTRFVFGKNCFLVITLAAVLFVSFSGLVGASDIYQGHPLEEIDLGSGAHQDLNMSGKNIEDIGELSGFFGDECNEDEVVVRIGSDGEYVCKHISDDLGAIGGEGQENYIPRFDDSNTLSTSNIYQSGGNIGIGTTTPDDKLEVSGGHITAYTDSGHGPNIMSKGEVTGSLARMRGAVSGDGVGALLELTDEDGNRDIWLRGGPSDSYINYGNFGIGTTSPGAKLHIDGETYMDNHLTFTGSSTRRIYGPEGNVFWGSSNMGIDANNHIRFRPGGGGDGDIEHRMTSDGDFGIGTTSPEADLHVDDGFAIFGNELSGYDDNWGANSIQGHFQSEGPLDGEGYIETPWVYTNAIEANNKGSGTTGLYIGEHTGTGTGESNELSLRTSGTNALTVDPDQNVGIGTTSPDAKLDVDGDVVIADGERIHLDGDSSTGDYISNEDGIRYRTEGGMSFYTGGFNERVTIQSGGDLDVNNNRITDLGEPEEEDDAARLKDTGFDWDECTYEQNYDDGFNSIDCDSGMRLIAGGCNTHTDDEAISRNAPEPSASNADYPDGWRCKRTDGGDIYAYAFCCPKL